MEESATSSNRKLVSLPPEDISEDIFRRLWIGNIDKNVSEFHLLKVVEKYGYIEKFDFHYEKSLDNRRKPKGYCFVTYKDYDEAKSACLCLNGITLGDKRIKVYLANQMKKVETKKTNRPKLCKDQLKMDSRSNQTRIREIEEKLKSMHN